MDDASRAATMFGGTAPPEPEPRPDPGGSEEAQRAERLYGGPRPEYRSPYEADPKPESDGPSQDEAGEPEPEPLDLAGAAEEVGLDPADPMFPDFAEVASDLGLDKEGVKKLVDLDVRNRVEGWQKISDDWAAEAQSDPEYDVNVNAAREVVRRYGDDALVQDLERLHLGNHPGLIRLLGKVGRAQGLGNRRDPFLGR